MATKETKHGIEGWLRRKGGPLNTWSRKWCVLNDKILFIYARDDDKKWQDMSTLHNQIIIVPTADLSDSRQGYFSIVPEGEKHSSETVHLCAETDAERKKWLHALKRALYADKGGALFSQNLDDIVFWEKKEGRRIPYIVDECVEYLYKYGLDVEGIFRLPGRQATIKDVIARFEQGHKLRFEEEEMDVHVVASVFKTFLRELPDSIIPCEFYQKFMNIALRFMDSKDDAGKDKCVEEMAEAMKLIPQDNYVILKYVCHFLHEVGQHEAKNKMTMMNLGTVFGYNIIRHIDKENSQLFLCTADLAQNLVFILLHYFHKVFCLEYSDKSIESNIPTADLLRMSRAINKIPLNPQPVSPSHMADLEGIDLAFSSTNSERSSDSSVRVSDDHFFPVQTTVSLPDSRNSANVDDNVFIDNKPHEAKIVSDKRKPLYLSMSSPGDKALSPPLSPDPGSGDAPVAPRRAKSAKVRRNQRVEQGRQEARWSMSMRSPRSPVPQEVNSQDVLAALAQAGSTSSESSKPSTSSTPSRSSSSKDYELANVVGEPDPVPLPRKSRTLDRNFQTSSGDGKLGPSCEQLLEQVEALKQELVAQKSKAKEQIRALKTQLVDMGKKYERRIETLESDSASRIQELQNKLINERDACAAAVANTIKLKEELHRYQMHYGELS